MTTIADRFRALFYKASQARTITVMHQVGIAQPTPANYENIARKGYSLNATVFACVSKIAQAGGGIRWEAFTGRKSNPTQVEVHPLLTLLERPNPMQASSAFFESSLAFYVLTGNSYTERVRPTPSQPPSELYALRPDRMKVVPGKNGFPMAYILKTGQAEKTWAVDFTTLDSDILHLKTFNPLNDHYGMAPIEAAMLSLDQNNAGSVWNLSLLRNSATPSGVLQMKATDANPRGELNDESFRRLQNQLDESHQGAKNTGRPMLLEGGLSWQQISINPKDMDFMASKGVTELDICKVFGVPPELIGLGQKTFNNYKEARLAFYEETVLPLMDLYRDEYNRWLAPEFGDNVWLEYDKDDIEALTYKREQKFATVKDVTFLTQNEKRESVGYAPVEGWDVFHINGQLLEEPEEVEEIEEVEPDPEEAPIAPEDMVDESEKRFKVFNLLNRNEKKRSWKRQNMRRARLAKNFERDIALDYHELARKLAKAYGETLDPNLKIFAMTKALSDFMPTIARTMAKHIRLTAREFGEVVLDEGKSYVEYSTKQNLRFDSYVDAYVKERTGTAISTITSTNQKTIERVVRKLTSQAIANGDPNTDLTDELLEAFDDLTPASARRIARTEVGLASNNAAIAAVKSLQIPGMRKEWVSANDDRVRDDAHNADHAAVNGVVVEIDDKFTVPPDATMEGPGDPSAPAEQIINCRCVLAFKPGK